MIPEPRKLIILRVEFDEGADLSAGFIRRAILINRELDRVPVEVHGRTYSSRSELEKLVVAIWRSVGRTETSRFLSKFDVVLQFAMAAEGAFEPWELLETPLGGPLVDTFKAFVIDPTVGEDECTPVDLPDPIGPESIACVWTSDPREASRLLHGRRLVFAGPPAYAEGGGDRRVLLRMFPDRAAVALLPHASAGDAFTSIGLAQAEPSVLPWADVVDKIAALRRSEDIADAFAYRIFLMDATYRDEEAYSLL